MNLAMLAAISASTRCFASGKSSGRIFNSRSGVASLIRVRMCSSGTGGAPSSRISSALISMKSGTESSRVPSTSKSTAWGRSAVAFMTSCIGSGEV
jgi:hypothetical protein